MKNSVIKYPILSEKTSAQQESANQYSFAVSLDANKLDVKKAVEGLKKDIEVTQVRTQVVRGKVKRVGASKGKRPNWKKAIVRLKSGQSLDLLESL
ncbi:MAG: 50S ribosomal protein L23 [Bradymonadales bacterium]|nr:MAG: 50S ribosomal protein L23 [Bradymonadales bacterium]